MIQDGHRYYSEMPMMGVAIHRDAFDLEVFLTEEGKSYLQLPGADLLIGLGVGGIPHSVIIDKKGVVRKVHVGFGPGMEGMLKEEILQLLAE